MARRDRTSSDNKVVDLHEKRADNRYEVVARRVVEAMAELNAALAEANGRADMNIYVLPPNRSASGYWEYGITRLTHGSPGMTADTCQPPRLAIPFDQHDQQ